MISGFVDVISLLGIVAFAISGALVGVRKRLDLLGVTVVGVATGTGGGIIRDVVLGVHPPIAFTNWSLIVVSTLSSLLIFRFHPGSSTTRRWELTFDAFGLGLFSATAATNTAVAQHAALTAILVGVITAIGGGMTRDVLVNEVPAVLNRELYAVSAIVGATIATTVVKATSWPAGVATILGGTAATGLRLLSLQRGWHLPRATPRVEVSLDPAEE